jgi:hypothetical protein
MIRFVTGDPLLTRAPFLAISHNARGRTELGAFETAAMMRYPVPFASYQRRCRQGKHVAGTFWPWFDAAPGLLFCTVRESSVGVTRLRYVQSILMSIARDYVLYGIRGLAIAPMGNSYERTEILPLISIWLGKSTLPVVVYTEYQAGIMAEETWDTPQQI